MSSARSTVVHPYLRAMPQPWHTVTCLPMSSSGRRDFGGGASPFLSSRTATGNVVGRMNSSSLSAAVLVSIDLLLAFRRLVFRCFAGAGVEEREVLHVLRVLKVRQGVRQP